MPHGTAVIQNGKILYTAANGYVGPDDFTYTITGQTGLTATGSVNVTVTAATPPTAAADSASLLQGTSILIDVLANDTGLALILTSVTTPQYGTAVIQNGKILYTAPSSYAGADTFSYTETDINGQTASAGVAVTVAPAIVPPATIPTNATVIEGNAVAIDVLANDTGTGLSITAVGAVAHGTATIQAGKLLYTAANGYVGPDDFTYTITGQTGLTATGSVNVTVTEIPPVANPDTATVVAGGSVLVNVLANDTGTGLTLTSVSQPANGTAAIQNGQILYTPAAGFVGTDALSYGLTDTAGETASAALTLTVTLPAPATNLKPIVFSPALNVAENAGATAIGIQLPTDPDAASAALVVTITALPTNGIVTLSNGTPIAAGQTITATQLTTLLFTPTPGLFTTVSALSYSVSDPAGNSSVGSAELSIGPAFGQPVVSQPSLVAAPGASATPIGIAAPTDPNFAASALVVIVQALPTNGIVTLADGTPLVGAGQMLTTAQLAGLLFTPASGVVAGGSALTYNVIDPAGNASVGIAALAVGPVSSTPTIGFVPPAGGATVPLAITDEAQPAFAGTAAANAQIAISGAAGTTQANASGNFTYAPSITGVGLTGLTVSVAATATAGDLPVSAPSTTVSVLMLPQANAAGVVQTDLSSLDIANALNAGYSLQMTPGTEAIDLVDGILSVGPDTNEAFIQRLYIGLLGRSYDAGGMAYWDLLMANGASKQTIAADFLNSAEFLARPQASNETAFVTSLYQSFLGRAPDAAGLAYWTSAPVQALGQAWIVAQFDDQPETKIDNAFATSMVFARNADGTMLHDIYETGLGREAELGGLTFWESLVPGDGVAAIAQQIAAQPESLADHGNETNAQYVTDLFTHATGAAPTTDQLNSDVARLQSGLTRGALLLEIASSAAAQAYLTSDNFGQPPVLNATASVNVTVGQTVTHSVVAQDPDRTAVTYSLVNGPAGAVVDPVTGLFTWAGSLTPMQALVTVAATDPTGLVAQQSFTLNVLAAAPTLSATGPGTAIAGTNTYVSLSQTGSPVAPGAVVTSWIVSWGDGSALQTVSGAAVQMAHAYLDAGNYQISAEAVTAGFGTFAAAPVAVAVTAGTLTATSLVAETSGFHVRFNGVLDPTTLSLLPDAAGDAPSIIVTGASGVVSGSIVLDPDGAGFRFIATSGALADGSYQVVIRGVVTDMRGRALDGNGDGTAGDDLTTSFTVHNDVDTLSLPAFMRGPDQAVAVPAAASGLPVSFTSDGTVTSVVFTVAFDPSLLAVTGAVAAAGLPEGATIGFVTTTLADGRTQATITVQSATPIAAGTAPLVDLVAGVPATAAYGATTVLSLDIVSVNGVAQALPETSGLEVVGYLGDADGSGTLTSADAARILRVVGGADSGFAFWRGIAPSVIADLNGDGSVTAADAALVGLTAPPIPSGISLVTASATPFVSAPTTLQAAAGGTVTVPVTLDGSVVLSSGTITLRYNPADLTLTAVRADPSSGLTVTASPGAGGIVSVSISQAVSATVTGVLALFDFQVASSVQPGTNLALDLSAVTLDGQNLDSRPGADGTDGDIAVLPAGSSPPTVVLSLDAGADDTTASISPTRAAQALLLGGTAA